MGDLFYTLTIGSLKRLTRGDGNAARAGKKFHRAFDLPDAMRSACCGRNGSPPFRMLATQSPTGGTGVDVATRCSVWDRDLYLLGGSGRCCKTGEPEVCSTPRQTGDGSPVVARCSGLPRPRRFPFPSRGRFLDSPSAHPPCGIRGRQRGEASGSGRARDLPGPDRGASAFARVEKG